MAAFSHLFRFIVPDMGLKGLKKSPHSNAFSLRIIFYQTAFKTVFYKLLGWTKRSLPQHAGNTVQTARIMLGRTAFGPTYKLG